MKQQFVHFIYFVILSFAHKQSNPPHFSGLGTDSKYSAVEENLMSTKCSEGWRSRRWIRAVEYSGVDENFICACTGGVPQNPAFLRFSRGRGPRLNPILLTTPTQTDWTFGYYNNNNSRGFLIGIPLCRETPVGFSSLPLHNNSEILLNQLEIRLYLPIKILKNKFCVCTTTAKCCQNTARLISRSIYLSSFVFRGKGN